MELEVYWNLLGILVCCLAYVLNFTEATRVYGRAICVEPGLKKGLQDAITPPWFTKFASFVYISLFLLIIALFVKGDFKVGIGAIVIVVVGSAVVGAFVMPTIKGQHFSRVIYRSLVNRHADYVRAGDSIRAEAMKTLIDRFRIGILDQYSY